MSDLFHCFRCMVLVETNIGWMDHYCHNSTHMERNQSKKISWLPVCLYVWV